jgi:hypothetical protein
LKFLTANTGTILANTKHLNQPFERRQKIDILRHSSHSADFQIKISLSGFVCISEDHSLLALVGVVVPSPFTSPSQ